MRLNLALPSYQTIDINDVEAILPAIFRVMTSGPRPDALREDFAKYFGRPLSRRHYRHTRLTRHREEDRLAEPVAAFWEV